MFKWRPPFTQSFQDIKTEVVLQLGSGLAYAMKQQGSSWWDSAAVCCLGPDQSYHLLLETYPGNHGKKNGCAHFSQNVKSSKNPDFGMSMEHSVAMTKKQLAVVFVDPCCILL